MWIIAPPKVTYLVNVLEATLNNTDPLISVTAEL
jgi:hypothetical protein